MSDANLDSTDLKAALENGWIAESVLNKINDISPADTPVMSLIGSGSHGNEFHEWLRDQLTPPTIGGWVVDGADAGADSSSVGTRVGNHSGILDEVVKVSTRARNSDTFDSEALAYQLRKKNKEIRTRVEANMLGIQGSQASDANAGTPGIPAALPVMMTKFDTGGGGTGGDFSGSLWSAWTPGVKATLTETIIRDAAQAAYEDGGSPTHLTSVPSIIRNLSTYMFDSSSRIATLTGETNNRGPATAMGSVTVFLTDFNIELRFLPNRQQLAYTSSGGTAGDAAAVMLLDPEYAEVSYLHGYRVEPLAKTGLADNRQLAVDFTFVCHEPNAHRALMDIDVAAAVTQS